MPKVNDKMPATVLTLTDIDRICQFPDRVIRNLLITQCYHDLSLILRERTGGTANWCTFATWASKQAGQTIRKEDLGRKLEGFLGTDMAARQSLQDLAAAIRKLGTELRLEKVINLAWKAFDPQASFERSSEAVARGNLKVFAEIGREFARFYSTFLEDKFFDAQKISDFLNEMRPGEPPEGQNYLRQAFMHYYQALFEADRRTRLELLLLANLEIGYHEQIRLQPEINEALSSPVISPESFSRNLMKAINPDWTWINELLWFVMRLFGRLTTLDTAITAFFAAAQREAQFIITETMMTIDLPGHNRLRLGRDLTVGFPPDLREVTNPDLLTLFAIIDPTRDSTLNSGAEFWGDLLDRLHFIADMFRCYQLSQELFDPPFTPDQKSVMLEGRLPPGRL